MMSKQRELKMWQANTFQNRLKWFRSLEGNLVNLDNFSTIEVEEVNEKTWYITAFRFREDKIILDSARSYDEAIDQLESIERLLNGT